MSLSPQDDKPPEEPLKFYQVRCPKCKQMPGFPCKFKRIKNDIPVDEVDYWAIHVSRVLLYEVFALGNIDEMGVSKVHTDKGVQY